MTALGKAFEVSRRSLVSHEDRSTVDLFLEWFGFREGTYLEIEREGRPPKQARVLAIDQCFEHDTLGKTAYLKVCMLLANGRIGVGRGMTLIKKPGHGFKCLMACSWRTVRIVGQPAR